MSDVRRYVIVAGTIVDEDGVVRGAGQSIDLPADCAARLNSQIDEGSAVPDPAVP